MREHVKREKMYLLLSILHAVSACFVEVQTRLLMSTVGYPGNEYYSCTQPSLRCLRACARSMRMGGA